MSLTHIHIPPPFIQRFIMISPMVFMTIKPKYDEDLALSLDKTHWKEVINVLIIVL